jgi:hypothetical protein
MREDTVLGRPMQWDIVIWMSPDREYRVTILAPTVCDAICVAIAEARMKPEELVHEIHISPPKAII